MNTKTKPSRALPAIVTGGLLAGACDIIFAFLFYGNRTPSVPPMRVLQSVASGVFGAGAFTGGAKMAAAGFIFHFLIATIFAAIFYLASRQLTFLIATIVSAVVLESFTGPWFMGR